MSIEERIQGGLDILKREARGSRCRSWTRYNDIMRRAEDHVWACGGDWFKVKEQFSREILDLMNM